MGFLVGGRNPAELQKAVSSGEARTRREPLSAPSPPAVHAPCRCSPLTPWCQKQTETRYSSSQVSLNCSRLFFHVGSACRTKRKKKKTDMAVNFLYDPEIMTSFLLFLLEETREAGRLSQLIKFNFVSLVIRELCTRKRE